MARYEIEGNPGLYGTHEYTYPSRSPAHITRETSHCLDLLQIDIADKSHARNFLANETHEFLGGVQRGFLGKYTDIAAKRNISLADQRFFYLEQERARPADDEDIEAFNFTLVTFCMMPEYGHNPLLPGGYSRGGVLAPPFTLREFYSRIQELQTVNVRVAGGGHFSEDMRDNSMLRYGLYHRVGSTLPIQLDTREADAKELACEQWNKMLDNIDIAL